MTQVITANQMRGTLSFKEFPKPRLNSGQPASHMGYSIVISYFKLIAHPNEQIEHLNAKQMEAFALCKTRVGDTISFLDLIFTY